MNNINEAAEAVMGVSGTHAVGWIATVHDRGDGTLAIEVIDWQPAGKNRWTKETRLTVETTNDEWMAAIVQAAKKHGALNTRTTTTTN